MSESKSHVSFTFIGSEKKPTNNGMYTPLLVPNAFTGAVSQETSTTPFSKIKNHLLGSLANGNFNNIPLQTINVVKNFLWTISPKSSRDGESSPDNISDDYRNIADETPYIILKEKYFIVNNIIAQGLYSLTSALNVANQTDKDGVNGVISSLGSAAKSIINSLPTPAANFLNSTGAAIDDNIVQPVGQLTSSAVDNIDKSTSNWLINQLLKYNNPDLEQVLFPYQKLYIVGPTGFKYKLPYLRSNVLNVNNSFGDSSDSSISNLTTLINRGTSAIESLGGFGNILSQAGGARIERSKYYNYASTSQPIEIVLPLYNTKPATYSDVCNNYKLVFLLMYQNLPLRQDKMIVEPPVMYDVTIPGNRREPYCYMSSIVINYKGNTRVMDIDTAGIASTDSEIPETIKTIIPDMYEIKLRLQPMLATTKNMLFTTINDNVVQAS